RTPKPPTPRPTRGNNPRAHSTDPSDISPEIHKTPQTLPPGIPVVVFPKKSCPYSPVMLYSDNYSPSEPTTENAVTPRRLMSARGRGRQPTLPRRQRISPA